MKIIQVLTACVLFSLLLITNASAETKEQPLPKIIISGLNEFAANGSDAAVKAWLKGSAIENSKEAAAKATAMFSQIKTFYGNYVSYDYMKMTELTPKTKIVY